MSVHPKDISQSFLSSAACTNEYLPTVAMYLKLLVDEDWSVSHLSNTLYLTKLVNPANPYVERSITWADHNMELFVFNCPLDTSHCLWSFEKPDCANWGSVADFLATVAKSFLVYEACSGVITHSHLWSKFSESGHANVFSHSEPPCLRSTNCQLLGLYPTKCLSCRQLQKKLIDHTRQKTRTAARINVDKTKVNTRFLQKEELKAREKRIRNEKKLSAQTMKRLKKRINKLLQEKSVIVSKELKEDFIEVLNNYVGNMTALENLFWSQQSEALSKRGKLRTMRWHPAMIRLALHFRMVSPAAYVMSGILSLPSSRRLHDYSQFTEIQEGLQQDLLEELKKLIDENCKEEYKQYFSLLLDEMSIKSDLVYSSRTGQLIGFTNLTSLEEELSSLEDEIAGKSHEKNLAKKVLVFMLNGCVNPILFVAAVYSTDDLSAAQLYVRTWDVIYAVEEAGAKVLTVIFDGASVNRKFARMHFNIGDKDFVYVTVNLASGESRSIFFKLDPPHLLKTFRNCFANSFSHRHSRQLFRNDQKISWKAIKVLFEMCKSDKFKTTKLTKAHVFLTSFSCMNVSLAAQVFSKSVANALRRLKDSLLLRGEYTDELVTFIELMNRCFDCLNGGERSEKRGENPDLLEYLSSDDSRLKFLKEDFISYLEEWEKYVQDREGPFSKEQRGKMIISYQSVEGIKVTINSFAAVCRFLLNRGAPSVSSRKFNQDPLEQKFSDFRRSGGANENPNLKQVLHTRLSLQSQGGIVSRTKRGNTETQKIELPVDDTPLPTRKKLKKD